MADARSPRDARLAALPLSDALGEERERLECARNDRGGSRRPFDPWDLGELTGGLPAGRLFLLAGHAGVGKTTAALSLVRRAARADARTLLFSLETDRCEVARRLWSLEARIEPDRLRAGEFPEEHGEALHEGYERLRGLPLLIADPRRPSAREIAASARHTAATAPLRLIVVDGLDFLFDKNRLNVAVSRAQCLAVLVYSPRLLDADCRTLRAMELLDGVRRFVELAEGGAP